MGQLLLDAFQFLFDVPHADAAVCGSSHELVVVDGVELPVVDCVGMSLGQVEVLYVHVPLYGQQVPRSVLVQESQLFVAVYYHQVGASCVETQIADGVSSERFHYAEAVHVFIHSVEVPQTHVVVEAARRHPMSLGLHCDAGNRLGVAIQSRLRFDGNAQLKPGGFFAGLLLLIP